MMGEYARDLPPPSLIPAERFLQRNLSLRNQVPAPEQAALRRRHSSTPESLALLPTSQPPQQFSTRVCTIPPSAYNPGNLWGMSESSFGLICTAASFVYFTPNFCTL